MKKTLHSKIVFIICSYIVCLINHTGLRAQNTYYYVHNDITTNLTQYTKDQVNATNTGSGTAYWKHFSTVSGGTLTTQLVPGSTPITAADNIIFTNSSLPTRTVTANYIINIDNTGAGLICQDYDASGWNPAAGQLQTMSMNIVTQIQCYRHFRLSPSDKFIYLGGSSLTFPNNSAAAIDSIHFYGTARSGGNSFRYITVTNINVNSNGKVYFCDTVNVRGGIGNIIVRANDNVGSAQETHFLETVYQVSTGIYVRAGNLYIHKNIYYTNELKVGQDLAGGNVGGPVTANARIYTHAAGYYSSPGVWNPGLWVDPGINTVDLHPYPYSSRNQNVIRLVNLLGAYRGILDASNTSFNEASVYLSYGYRGSGLIGNGGIDFITNSNTFVHMSNRSLWSYRSAIANGGVYQGFKLRGTYFFENANSVGATSVITAAEPVFSRDTIVDSLFVKNNINGLGMPNGASTLATAGRITIASTGYARFYPGYLYNMGIYYSSTSLTQIYNEGTFIMGDTLSCGNGSKVTKTTNLNLAMSATGSQIIGNTQFENSQLLGAAAQRAIHYSNTDLGGNNGLIFKLYAGQNTMNGIVPASGNYTLGTVPYNAIPFTGSKSRTLHWNNLISGGGTNNCWTQNLWYNEADGDNLYNDCPPTFIDSVIVEAGSTLRIDQRATQCKSFVALGGAPITLAQRAKPLSGAILEDSLSTLEIFGNFHLNQQMNNMLNRNIVFKAWQTYPTIRTSNTKFWRGFFFRAINTGTNNPLGEINPGSWTLLDNLNVYNQNITFSPRPNSAPGCMLINYTAVTNPILDPSNGFWQPATNDITYNHILQLLAGNLYTNNKTIHTYNFFMGGTAANTIKNLYLGSSEMNIYANQESIQTSNVSSAVIYGTMFWTADKSLRINIYPGTSHIKLHCKAFFSTFPPGSNTNITSNTFGAKGQNYYDVSFLQNDTAAYSYMGPGGAVTGALGAGITRAGILHSVNCNYHNITFWSNDPSYAQMSTFRDTINKIEFKRSNGSMNAGEIRTYGQSNGVVAPTVSQTNSSIDSLIFNTKVNTICAVSYPGNLNIKRYLYLAQGSTNTLWPGARHRLYNTTSTVYTAAQGGEPWIDLTPGIPSSFPGYLAPPAKSTYTWGPSGAKLKARSTCDNAIIIKYGGFLNAGNAVVYPTPYHWSGTAPRDTFDVSNLTVIDDSLTQFQVVDGSTLLLGSTLNWDAGTYAPRNLIFRDGGASSSSWFDKSKWAVLTFTALPNYTTISGQQTAINYSVGATGECPPVCGDITVFDNASFSATTNMVDLGNSNSAYVGTIVWNQGVAGNLKGASTSVLNICNSLYLSKAMTNSFLGQTVFSATDSSNVEYIQTGPKSFNNQVLFNARNASKYKTSWKLLDSLATLPIGNAITPAVKINKGTLDTRGKNLSIIGGVDLNSTSQRGLLMHNSRLYATGGRAGYAASGNGIAFMIEGDYTKLQFKADSSDILCEAVYATSPTTAYYDAHFEVWNAGSSSQFYTTTRKGFKFNNIEVRSLALVTTNQSSVFLRSDTVNSLTITGRTVWSNFYKGYIKSFTLNTPASSSGFATVGNTNSLTDIRRFKGRIDTVRLTHLYAAAASPINWDTLYVKDEFTIKPGTSLLLGQGGLTWLGNNCNTRIVGTSALPVAINPGASAIGSSYNYPSGNRTQNEHYLRKDSGTVCTDYAQLYNIWAIGNGNGNNNCSGGTSYGCSVGTANSSAYGSWMLPVMSPTLGIRTLADTTLYSSETPAFSTAGRARFLAGSNADFGYPNPVSSHNCAGWDPTPSPTFPPALLTLSQTTVCPNTSITASLTLGGSVSAKDFPITAYYTIGSTGYAYTFTSTASNPYTFTFTTNTSTNTNVSWVKMANASCNNSTLAINTTATIFLLPATILNTTQLASSAICTGASTSFSVSGAISYTWSTGQNTSSISVSPTVAKVYSVVGTNTAGCSSSPPTTFTLNVNPLPAITLSAKNNVTCFGLANGSVSLTPSGGSGSGYSIIPTSTVNLSPGSYTYTVKDGANCTSTAIAVAISQPTSALTASISSLSNNSSCTTPNGAITILPAGGTGSSSYVWSNSSTSSSISGLTGGVYTVTVTDANLCTFTTQATIASPVSPTITASISSNTICSGNTITLSPAGPANMSYTITPSVGTVTAGITGPISMAPAISTSYSVTGTNTLTGCSSNAVTLSVNVNATPQLSITATNTVICNGQSTTLNLSGAGTYTLINTGLVISSSTSFNPPANITYTVQGTTAGCNSSFVQQSVTVNATPTLAITASTATLCSGQTTTLTASSANTYNWSTGATGNTLSLAPTTTSVISVIGTNTAGSCTATAQYSISVNATPTLAITTATGTLCSGQTMTLTASSANTYNWSTGATGNTLSLAPTSNTVISVIGTNTAGSCTATTQYSITVNATPTLAITASTGTICSGQTTTLTASTANTYNWNTGATGNTLSLAPTSNTIISVVGTNTAGNCSATAQYSITVNTTPTLAITASTGTLCSGQTTTLTAATANTYNWSTGTSGNTLSLAPTSNTVISVVGTNTAGSCTATAQYSITVNATPTLAITGTSVICSGKTTALTASSANSYNWSTGATGNTLNVAPTTNTIISVIGTNTAGSCTATAQYSITVNATPTLAITGTSVICSGKTATLTALTANAYNWNTGALTNSITVAPTTNTVYTATGTNTYAAGSCTANATYSIQVNLSPVLSPLTVNVSCFGLSNGSATLTPSSGTPGYTITGTNIAGNTATNLAPNTYTYTVTDATGCSTTSTLAITQPSAALLSSAVQTASNTSCTNPDGVATLTITGGSPGYTVTSSSGTVLGTGSITGLNTGLHSYNVTDVKGCTTSNTLTINGASGITSSLTAQTNVLCYGNNTASISIQGSGEVSASYSYSLTAITATTLPSANTTGSFGGLSQGTYSVLIKGTVSNCISTQNVSITQPASAVTLAASTGSILCYGDNALATATVTGGTPSYTVNWNGSNSSATSHTFTAGTYTINASDANNCVTVSQTLTVIQPTAALSLSINTPSVLCHGDNMLATAVVTGGTPSYTLNWNGSAVSATSHTFTAGNYTVNVVDANNCITATRTLTINQPLTPLSALVSNIIPNSSCASPNGAFTVTANGGTPGYTYNTSNTTGIFLNQSTGSQTVNVRDANACTYTVTATVPGVPSPSITAATQTNVACNGMQTGAAAITVSGGTAPYLYNWSNGFSGGNILYAVSANTYSVTISDAGNCTATYTFSITEPMAMHITTHTITAPCSGQNNGSASIDVSGGSPTYAYTWTGNASSSNIITDVYEGQYIATVTDANGCNQSYPLLLTAGNGQGCSILIPELFSPNGDGKNDNWEIKGLEDYPNNNVQIFNRWGDEVFKANPYQNNWNGTNEGDKSFIGKGALPVGTYYFILDLGNQTKAMTGYIQITK